MMRGLVFSRYHLFPMKNGQFWRVTGVTFFSGSVCSVVLSILFGWFDVLFRVCVPCCVVFLLREKQGGVESQRRETYHNAPPQKRCRFPPPLFVHAVSFPERQLAQTRRIPLPEASKSWFWRGHSIVRFPPPSKKIAR